VLETSPRRGVVVAAQGAAAARTLLRGTQPLRLAGSDDPGLDLLLAAAGDSVARVGTRGSLGGLAALWQRRADAAALHLHHVSGEYNAPFARRLLEGRRPVLVRLWHREQGLVVAPGNPHGITGVNDLERVTTVLRGPNTGTRALLERLLRESSLNPQTLHGPEAESHLDVGLTVACGLADCGVAVRSGAAACGLDFIPLTWEPFDLALPEDELDRLDPLLSVLSEARHQIEALSGYDLQSAGAASSL
jgi:molybdate-binding protein